MTWPGFVMWAASVLAALRCCALFGPAEVERWRSR